MESIKNILNGLDTGLTTDALVKLKTFIADTERSFDFSLTDNYLYFFIRRTNSPNQTFYVCGYNFTSKELKVVSPSNSLLILSPNHLVQYKTANLYFLTKYNVLSYYVEFNHSNSSILSPLEDISNSLQEVNTNDVKKKIKEQLQAAPLFELMDATYARTNFSVSSNNIMKIGFSLYKVLQDYKIKVEHDSFKLKTFTYKTAKSFFEKSSSTDGREKVIPATTQSIRLLRSLGTKREEVVKIAVRSTSTRGYTIKEGVMESVIEEVYNNKSKLDGKQTSYNHKNQIIYEGFYENGLRHGTFIDHVRKRASIYERNNKIKECEYPVKEEV